MTLRLESVSQSPGRLGKHKFLGPFSIVSEAVYLGGSAIICISNKFPGDADAAGMRTTSCGLEEPCKEERSLGP